LLQNAEEVILNYVHSEGAHHLYGALSLRGSDTIKPAYNPTSAAWPTPLTDFRQHASYAELAVSSPVVAG